MNGPAKSVRYLLLQIRDADDPMRAQEVSCFAQALNCEPECVCPFDLLQGGPSRDLLRRHDVVLIGGAGRYSVASEGQWLQRALDAMRHLHDSSKPTFASCWGFQAMSRAMGGQVIHDLGHAELGTLALRLTESGRDDPVFGYLGDRFDAQMGHEDRVVRLPPDATLLASTDRVANQAFRFEGRPIYGTQFHPELNRAGFLERVVAYPEYVAKIAGMTHQQFVQQCHETPQAGQLLMRFVEHVLQ